MKRNPEDQTKEELQAKIKELEEKLAADEERRIAGFGNVGVLEEYEEGDKKKVILRKAVDLESGKTTDVIDTDYAVAEEQVRRKEDEKLNYIKVMEQEGLKRADDYKRHFDNYEKSLKNLEACIQNLNLCTTQTSLNLALIMLWLEIEYVTTKFGVLREELKYNTFYAFCCNMNFRDWAKKMRQLREHIVVFSSEGQVSDEMYLQPLDSIPHAYINPSNRVADEDTFAFLVDSMKPYGRGSSLRDFHTFKTLSDNLLPILYKLRDACNTSKLRRGIKSRLEVFSDNLDDIHRMVSSPSLDNLGSVYYCFDDDEEEVTREVDAFVNANGKRANFIHLISEKMRRLQDKQISKYCDETTWHDLFDWEDNDCQPLYEKLGEFIFKFRDQNDRIDIAKDIVRLVNYWLHYNWAILSYQERQLEGNKGKDMGDISPSGIPKDLLEFILIEDKDKLMKFATLIRNDASKLCDETGRKDFWDYFYFICIHYKLVRTKPFKKKCSRVKFSKILSCILYGSDKEAERLQYMMEKSGLQATMPNKAVLKAIRSEIGKSIAELIVKQGLVKG
jgi:hypothetical protein